MPPSLAKGRHDAPNTCRQPATRAKRLIQIAAPLLELANRSSTEGLFAFGRCMRASLDEGESSGGQTIASMSREHFATWDALEMEHENARAPSPGLSVKRLI